VRPAADTSGGTRSGEPVRPERTPSSAPGQPGAHGQPEDIDPDEAAAQLEAIRSQLVATPAEVVVANHAYGLFELAAIHLSENPPNLDQARLAVDAMAALVDGLRGRLGGPEKSLTEALAQIRLAFIQMSGAQSRSDHPS
jgi:hypothetical protein